MSKGNFYYKNKNKKRGSNQEFRSENEILSQSKAKREDLLRPIEDLQLSENTYNALKAGRIVNLSDLACRTFRQMYKIQNIGKKNCIEISKAMAKYSVTFAPEKEEDAVRGDAQRNNAPNALAKDRDKKIKDSRLDEGRRENRDANKNKNKGENAHLNDYLTKLYAGMSLSEILMGKRSRPAVEKIDKPQLTEKSLVKFCRKGKWGYKDWKGNVIVPPLYEEAFGFFEERACVEKEGKLGYIDRENNLVIDFKYDCATSFSEGLASVTVGEKSGYIDADGNQIVDFIYDIATPFSGGKAIVRADDRWGVLSRENLSVFWR